MQSIVFFLIFYLYFYYFLVRHIVRHFSLRHPPYFCGGFLTFCHEPPSAINNIDSEIIRLRSLLTELGFSQAKPTPLHADNTSAIQIATNHVYHERTKHIEVDCHPIH